MATGRTNGKTKRVRIAVAMMPDGKWNSAGWYTVSDETKLELANAGEFRGKSAVYLVDVEVPLPDDPPRKTAVNVRNRISEVV